MDYSLDGNFKLATPSIEEIFNINLLDNYLKYAFDNIIFPHFGIPSVIADNIPMRLQLGKKINTFDVVKNGVKTGHISVDIIGTEINIKDIEIDDINAFIQLMQILSARYAPINPTIIIGENIDAKLNHIIKQLNFTKQNNIFKRPCRIIQ